MNVTITITKGALTAGTWVEGTSKGTDDDGRTVFESTWAGTFDGIRLDEHEGQEDYAYFRDGHINGTKQGLHGFPVAQFAEQTPVVARGFSAPAPVVLAIADEDDLLASVTASDLIDALMIATEQLDIDEDDDETAAGYGLDTARDALALRARLQTTLSAVNGAM